MAIKVIMGIFIISLMVPVFVSANNTDTAKPDPTKDLEAFCQWCMNKYNEYHNELLEYEHINLSPDFDLDENLMMVPITCKFKDGTPEGKDLSNDPKACKEFINKNREDIKNLTWVEERDGFPGGVFRLVGKKVYENWCKNRKGDNWKKYYDKRLDQSRALKKHIRDKFGSVFEMREKEREVAEEWNKWCKDRKKPEEKPKKKKEKSKKPAKTKAEIEQEERDKWFNEQMKKKEKKEPLKYTGPRYTPEQIQKKIKSIKSYIESLKKDNEKKKKSYMYNKPEDDIYRRTIRDQVKRQEQEIIAHQKELAEFQAMAGKKEDK